jgi:hypothetical protein
VSSFSTRFAQISTVEISKGTVNELLAHPRDILRPAIILSAFASVLVHNLWVATHKLCYVDTNVMCSKAPDKDSAPAEMRDPSPAISRIVPVLES